MYLSLEGPSLGQFQAAHAVSRWWGSGERSRHPGFAARVNRPTDAELKQELEEIEAGLGHDFHILWLRHMSNVGRFFMLALKFLIY